MEPIRYTSKTIKIMPNPYEEIATFKDEQFHFNFSGCLKWLEKTGRQLFGAHFRIYPEDHGLILALLVYAIADKESAEKKGLNLKKGILLTGPIGCGKTSLMTLVNYFLPQSLQYHIKSTRETAFEFEKEGYKVIHRYSNKAAAPPANTPSSVIYCFDDLGIEQPQKYFGNQCNVMAEILLSRHDLFVSSGIPTHVTTNLSASELEEKYGNRIRSRMREMFNLVAFDKNSKDKRT
jgi:energy-coupling factor transporter ATP-binding protein EcfA2